MLLAVNLEVKPIKIGKVLNNIFIKNLTALIQKNPKLVEKLQSFVPDELPKLVQENGTYNVLYKNNLLHNQQNPLAEANEIFKSAENTPVSIHLIYGLGLGYLFQVASSNSKGTVILLETDLNILWFAFTLVDFSNDILKQNVYIASTPDEAYEAIYKKSGMKNAPQLLSTPAQRNLNQKNFDELVIKLKEIIGSFSLDLKFTQEKFYPSLKMLIQNIPFLLKENPLATFKDTYKGKTAVIVSAGPTLDRNIETLKKHRGKYVLITVGTAVKTLYKYNIKPDFLCIIETYNSSKQIDGLDLTGVNFITEPYSNPALRNFEYQNIYSHISANNPINAFWTEVSGIDSQEYLSKGTVSYTALNSARILGFSKIILVGQDLAYIEGQCYSKDSIYKDLSCEFNKEKNKWEIVAKDYEKFKNAISASEENRLKEYAAKRRLENLNASLYYVKGINGDMVPTEAVYATFIRPLQEFTEKFNDIKYINTSLVGAQIDGFENLSLEEALKDSEVIENLNLSSSFEINKEDTINNLKNKLNELKSSLAMIKEGQRLSKNINNDIKRYRTINQDILKTLKNLSLNYINLSNSFAEKSKLFNFIITADKINLDYEMKMLIDFSTENVAKINDLLSSFYNNAEKRILEIEVLINESINSAS